LYLQQDRPCARTSPERFGDIWWHGHLSRELTLLGLRASGVEIWGRLIGSLGHLRVVHKACTALWFR
jgi:hypothetical protein